MLKAIEQQRSLQWGYYELKVSSVDKINLI